MKTIGDTILPNNEIDGLKALLLDQEKLINRCRQVFDSISDGIIVADNDRKIIMANPGMKSLFGYDEKELLNQQTNLLYCSKDDFFKYGDKWIDFKNGTSKISFETTFCKKDGSVFSGEVVGTRIRGTDGEIICIIKLLRDISERKELEDNLRHLEVKFRTIADFTFDWECWTKPDGSYQYISPSCERISGYSVDEFMKKPSLFRQIIHPEDQKIWDDHHHSSRIRSTSSEKQFRIIRRDGDIRWIEHVCQPVLGENNEQLGFRSSNRDITQRKVYELELQDALKEIERYKEKLEAETEYLQKEIQLYKNYKNIIGSSYALQYILFKIEQIATTDTAVLLLGETGTGKELFARAIHNTSNRKNNSLVTLNCATLPTDLIESELFGHEKGSFTSAHARQIGRFELADKGTIFLDEIGEIPFELQAKLLRVLQEGEFERLGGSKTVKVDVRVIAATNRDLEEEVRKGQFRKDLWYRLNVFPITAPPLRDRTGDIPQLAQYFMEKFSKKQHKNITNIPKSAMKNLENYNWPGNVRELENVIERAVINSSGTKLNLVDNLKDSKEEEQQITELKTLEEVERDYILKVLKKTNWKVSGKDSAAEILGMRRSTLRARIEKHNITKS